MTKAIFFLPVKEKFIKKWEYYSVDLDMLQDTFSEVIICQTNREFLKALFSNNFDFIFCWWWHKSLIPLVVGKIIRVPVYMLGAVHMYDESGDTDFFSHSIYYRIFLRIAWKFSSVNLFMSKSQYRQITSHALVNNPTLLQSSLTKEYNQDNLIVDKHRLNFNKKTKLLSILWMTQGTLKRKSIYEILDALVICIDEGFNNFEWTIAGAYGDGSQNLENRISELNLENYINIYYDISNDTKLDLYKSNDLYLQPSYYEGFGNAVLEAMSYGMPAVVSRNTAQAEVIGNSGFMVEEIEGKFIAKVLQHYFNFSDEDRIIQRELVSAVVKERHLYEIRTKKFHEILKNHNHLF
jgi:glycosyltransferase involved in cell wall biosynthesis